MEESAKDILAKVPKPVPIAPVMEKYPVMYEQSMNTVLVQEVIRYNKLLKVLHGSLSDLLKALKGLVVMSQALEEMANSLFINQVPSMWAGKVHSQNDEIIDALCSHPTRMFANIPFIILGTRLDCQFEIYVAFLKLHKL